MFRFVGFKTVENDENKGIMLLLDKVPDKKDLVGELKIARFCRGFAHPSLLGQQQAIFR
jgi:hypothetical protein